MVLEARPRVAPGREADTAAAAARTTSGSTGGDKDRAETQEAGIASAVTVPSAPRTGKAVTDASRTSGRFAVQIGIFAQAGNATKALSTLRAAGVSAFADTVNGDQQRVRAGPFSSQSEADRAARKIKALDLPAVVVKMRQPTEATSPAP